VKKLLISLAIAVIALLSLAVPAFAADPTDIEINWDGAGLVGGEVDTGDAVGSFQSVGAISNVGQFKATDSNDNPYNYGVDSGVFSLDTSISGSGWAGLLVNRTASKESMYGPAGQVSSTYVAIGDGSATLQNRSGTNYAEMRDCNYGWNANDHITAISSSYIMERFVSSGPGSNQAVLSAAGSGSADLDCMNAEASAGQVRLGAGCGCYTNADFTATGSGQMLLSAHGNNSAVTAMAPGMTGARSFDFIASWVGGDFSVSDYSTTAN